MSWWDIGGGGVIGDGPVDVLTLALSSAVREREDAGRPKPSLQSVLSGMAAALSVDDGRRPRIAASLADGREVSSNASGDDVATVLREALAEVRRQYEERWERPPERRELLETLLFVLAGGAGSFVRDVGAEEIRGIADRS
jgi:hypothetical protein